MLAPPSEVTLAARPPGVAAAPPALRSSLLLGASPSIAPGISAAGPDSGRSPPRAPGPLLPAPASDHFLQVGLRAAARRGETGLSSKPGGGYGSSKRSQVSTKICLLKCSDCEPNAGRRRLRDNEEVEKDLERLLLDPSSQCAHVLCPPG